MDNERIESNSKKTSFALLYAIIIPILIILFLLISLPKFLAFFLSHSDSTVSETLYPSNWFYIFKDILTDTNYYSALGNTIITNIIVISIIGILAVIIGISISFINNKILKNTISTIFLIPFFLPIFILMYFIIDIDLYKKFLDISIEGYVFEYLYVFTNVVKYLGVAIILILLFINYGIKKHSNNFRIRIIYSLKGLLVFILIKLTMLISIGYDYFFINIGSKNILAYTFGNENEFFKNGVWLFNFVFQLIVICIVVLVLRKRFFKYETLEIEISNSRKKSIIGTVLSVIFSLPILLALYYIFINPFLSDFDINSLIKMLHTSNFPFHLLMTFASTILGLFVALILSYPFSIKSFPHKKIYAAILLFMLALSTSGIVTYEIHLLDKFEIIETYIPSLYYLTFSIINIFIFKYSFKSQIELSMPKDTIIMFFKEYSYKLVPYIVTLGIIQFSIFWGSYFPMVLMFKQNILSEFTRTIDFTSTEYNAAGYQFGAIISFVPVLLFLAFRWLFKTETFIGRIRKG